MITEIIPQMLVIESTTKDIIPNKSLSQMKQYKIYDPSLPRIIDELENLPLLQGKADLLFFSSVVADDDLLFFIGWTKQ